jgi:hypothetical protein
MSDIFRATNIYPAILYDADAKTIGQFETKFTLFESGFIGIETSPPTLTREIINQHSRSEGLFLEWKGYRIPVTISAEFLSVSGNPSLRTSPDTWQSLDWTDVFDRLSSLEHFT